MPSDPSPSAIQAIDPQDAAPAPSATSARPLMPKDPTDCFDRYTVGMAAAGTLMGLNNLPWYVTLGLGVAFQLTREGHAGLMPGGFAHPRGETVAHDAVDIAALMIAWRVMRPRRGR